MSNLQIGSLILGDTPAAVAVVDSAYDESTMDSVVAAGADMFEFRADCFSENLDFLVSYLKNLKENYPKYPVILTVRDTERTRGHRLEYFGKLLPFADAIDIEIEAPDIAEVVKISQGKAICVSVHDFEQTPSDDQLLQLENSALEHGAHIVKIAAVANSRADVVRLLKFAEARSAITPVVMFSMGAIGTVSRVIAPLFGSLFTYGYIGEAAVAPGQLDIGTLCVELNRYFPDRTIKK